MPNINKAVSDKYKRLLSSFGKNFVNSSFPNDFEAYLMSFELVDSNNTTIEYFMFPIMPEEISESKKTLTTIRKTSSGINSMFNPTFTPISIGIKGNFGRQFKIMMNNDIVALVGVFGKLLNKNRSKGFSLPEFDISVKTGYGVMKKFQSIIEKSFSLDENGRPHKLFFNNYAFNTSYMVEIESISFDQNMASNMIWNYSLEMTALAPTEYVYEKYRNSLNKLMSFSNYSKLTTNIIRDINPVASNTLRRIIKIR